MSTNRRTFAGNSEAQAVPKAFAHYAHAALIVGFLLFIALGQYFSVGWFRR
jgi:hypothetical protein